MDDDSPLNPNEVRFEIVDGIEYATLRADDFRTTMRVSDAVHKAEMDTLRAENQRLLLDNAELSAECDQWQRKVADCWREIEQLRAQAEKLG